jgi:hypothetical protein
MKQTDQDRGPVSISILPGAAAIALRFLRFVAAGRLLGLMIREGHGFIREMSRKVATAIRLSGELAAVRSVVLSAAIVCALLLGVLQSHAQSRNTPDHVTVAMSVEGGVPIVTLEFKRPDGGSRIARFIFDSGGGAIILDEGLATDLGLKPRGADLFEGGQKYLEVDAPVARIGGMPLDLGNCKAFMHRGVTSFTNRDTVEGLLPGRALERYQVVLDYPRQLLSIGKSGTIPHRGERLSARYVASSGHPRVDVEIGDITYGFLLDTGTKLTLVREGLLRRWSREHPKWPRSRGAVGAANVDGAADDALLLRIQALRFGPFTVAHVAAAARPDQTYSSTHYETPAAIVGALGGNVLSQFRLEIDYPEQLLFMERSGNTQTNEFNTVGLVLDTNSLGQLIVRAVSPAASLITRRNIVPGDVIVQVGDSRTPYTLTAATRALSGAAGERKQLLILRKGKPMSVTVTVARIL